MVSQAHNALIAALAGRYSLERELGHGGMATVYLAHDLRHDRPVAIKVLNPELAAILGPERFLREIHMAAQLNHPHILPLHDSGEAGGFLFYVMPYVEGETLRDRLIREPQLPIEDAVGITREVADALTYAHGRGIVHRDIKPENIMLHAGHAVVADFGIARAVTEAGEDRLTQTGVAIGTPSYMSPEQAAGESRLDGRSDIYALGCVTYEMLTGEPPFHGPTAQAIIARHTLDPVPPVRTTRATVPHAVEIAVNKALAKSPADRFQTASKFAAALRDSNIHTTVPVPVIPPRRPVPRWIVAAGVLLMIAGVLLALNRRTAAPPPADLGRNPEAPGAAGDMVTIPAATYPLFGGTCRLCIPAARVALDSFAMDRTEVTVGQYAPFITAGLASAPWAEMPPDTLLPVTGVLWSEAVAYCRWRDGARLPSEAEWEAAARGTGGRRYPWGNDWGRDRLNADDPKGEAVPVGSFPRGAAPSGALDMAGNVWEWTATPGPAGRGGIPQYIIRGGAANSARDAANAISRVAYPAVAQRTDLDRTGFRCVK
jgi:formylglycine-generating enzyme required for sulfatase activity